MPIIVCIGTWFYRPQMGFPYLNNCTIGDYESMSNQSVAIYPGLSSNIAFTRGFLTGEFALDSIQQRDYNEGAKLCVFTQCGVFMLLPISATK